MLSFWLYVSEAKLEPELASQALADIVSVSTSRNADLEVTGALLFTGRYFAQLIEGPDKAVEELRASISADPRHERVTTLARDECPTRRCPNWSLAYVGPSGYVTRAVQAALAQEEPRRADQMIRLLVELSDSAGPKQ